MPDRYMHLVGSEQVQSAACTMQSAAEQMSRAAASIDESFARHQRFLEDWIVRFESVVPPPICDGCGHPLRDGNHSGCKSSPF